MAFPRHAEVGTASAILDSLGWDGLGRRRHSFPGDGNWNHAAPLDLQNISAEFNSSVVHQHNFRDTWPNLNGITWYTTLYKFGHFTPVAAAKSPVFTAEKTPVRPPGRRAVLHEAGRSRSLFSRALVHHGFLSREIIPMAELNSG